MEDDKYFLYSEDQFKEKNIIANKIGKEFIAGTVVVNGVRKRFTMLSSNSQIPRFIDTKIVAVGNPDKFTYEKPKSVKKGVL